MRARQMPQSANCAYDVHTFCPFSRQPPSTRVADVRRLVRSLPASGSLNSWQKMIEASRMPGSHRSF